MCPRQIAQSKPKMKLSLCILFGCSWRYLITWRSPSHGERSRRPRLVYIYFSPFEVEVEEMWKWDKFMHVIFLIFLQLQQLPPPSSTSTRGPLLCCWSHGAPQRPTEDAAIAQWTTSFNNTVEIKEIYLIMISTKHISSIVKSILR